MECGVILDALLGHHAVLLMVASVVVAALYLLRQLGRLFARCVHGARPQRR